MWNHVVTAKFHAASNGLPMLNWDHPYIRVEDASGNWDYLLASHRSLDPRYVWKLDTDFEPASNFPAGSILRLSLPKAGATITTNLLNLPVAISWDDDFLDASIPTNQANMALRYLSVEDSEGAASLDPSGSWNQFMFRKGSFMWRRNGDLITSGPQPKTLTFAIVTNVHAVFYVQPLLSPGENGK